MINFSSYLVFTLRKFFSKWQKDIDIEIFKTLFILILIGVITIATSGVAMSNRINLPYFYFLKKQIIFSLLGLFIIFIVSTLETRFLFNLSKLLFFILFLFLFYVSFFGAEIKGSRRWVDLSFVTIQPSDLIKPFFIILNGILISKTRLYFFRIILSFLFICLMCFLLIMQPDIGMTFLFITIFCIQIFFSKLPKEIFILTPLGVSFLLMFFYKNFEYIQKRVDVFFEHELSYQTMQSINSIKNGNFFGKLFGNGEYKYKLPDSSTDYIFSVFFEEFGYIGVLFLFTLYVKLFIKIFVKIKIFLEKDLEKFIISIGLLSVFFIQIFINISVAINLIPSKGMTLPFISYGGSSIISNCFIFGILLNLTRKDYSFKMKLNN